MPCWIALIPPSCTASSDEGGAGSQQHAVGCWALQFTPRVALLDEAVLLEVAASRRLFGGERALLARIAAQAHELGCTAVSWAPTSLAALALARSGVVDGIAAGPLPRLLDALPLSSLRSVAAHQPILARLGCRTLGDVRKLPRAGLNRRFAPELLTTLDQAYGHQPESHAWLSLPEAFEARLALPSRVDTAPALMFGARRLLLQMSGWLAARHGGVRHFTLVWLHDALRHRHVQAHGEITIRTAALSRHTEHFTRLLAEHLAKVVLQAPVEGLRLCAPPPEPLDEASGSLLLDDAPTQEPMHELLERLAARLGPERVRRPVLASDHRIEWMQAWQAADQPLPRQGACPAEGLPQPTWVWPCPLPLAVHHNKPYYQGVLQLMAGPHRIESGWWHQPGLAQVGADQAHTEQPNCTDIERDYYVALSPHAGLLWVYRERMPTQEGEGLWFLHGVFA